MNDINKLTISIPSALQVNQIVIIWRENILEWLPEFQPFNHQKNTSYGWNLIYNEIFICELIEVGYFAVGNTVHKFFIKSEQLK